MTDRQIHRPLNPPPPANKCLLIPTLSVQPSTALKKLNFNCWIRIQIPNPDPDPHWQFESGSNRIRIRNPADTLVILILGSSASLISMFIHVWGSSASLTPIFITVAHHRGWCQDKVDTVGRYRTYITLLGSWALLLSAGFAITALIAAGLVISGGYWYHNVPTYLRYEGVDTYGTVPTSTHQIWQDQLQ